MNKAVDTLWRENISRWWPAGLCIFAVLKGERREQRLLTSA
jgi:hypothetical protein